MLKDVLKKEARKLYLRPADYNRARALTLFVEWLEKTYKDKLIITNASIKNIHLRDSKTNKILTNGENCFYNFIGFNLNGSHYYCQYNDNPFFDSSYIAIDSNRPNEYYQKMEIFKMVDVDEIFLYSEKNIKVLKNDLIKQFKDIKEDNYNKVLKNEKNFYYN